MYALIVRERRLAPASLSISSHNKLHLRSSEFYRVSAEQWHGQVTHVLPIELEGCAVTLHLREHKAVGLLSDGGNGYAWLAQRGDDLVQRHFFARHAAAEHANDCMALGKNAGCALLRGSKAGNFTKAGEAG